MISKSVLAITDGENLVPLIAAQDYKRAYDNNEGPNTGGMGAIAPHPVIDDKLLDQIIEDILKPTILGLRFMGTPFVGVLYAGLMITDDGPKVLEFNCRFGDPETQVILPLMKSDLLELILHAIEKRVLEADVEWYDKKAVCVVIASGGYPKRYKKGLPIDGLDTVEGMDENIIVFHAGTAQRGDTIITNGGRVLNVVAVGNSFEEAASRAYEAVDKISFDRAFYRTDIASEYI